MSTPPAMHAGWYPDPSGGSRHRYWDGSNWTDHYRDTAPKVDEEIAVRPRNPVTGRWLISIGTAVACLVAGAAIGSAARGASKSAPSVVPVTVTATGQPVASIEITTTTVPVSAAEQQQLDQERALLDQRKRQLDARDSASLTPVAIAADTVLNRDGTFLVGIEVRPGTWRSDGGDACYWERLSATSGDSGDIIENLHNPGPQVVTIAASDNAFTTQGCGTWHWLPVTP